MRLLGQIKILAVVLCDGEDVEMNGMHELMLRVGIPHTHTPEGNSFDEEFLLELGFEVANGSDGVRIPDRYKMI
jgi:hypothetical protein